MKRFKSTKKNKNGVILVVVLLVLAVAMIFITSALMLTNATRNRTYDRATESQARMTVTSLSEAFYRTVQMQEITDTELWNYAGTKGSPVRLNITNSSGDKIPGLTSDSDNMSYVEIERATTGTEIGDVKVSFTTTIGGKTERVREYYKYTPKSVVPNFFRSQIDLIGDSNDVFNLAVGANAPNDATDNFIVVRGSTLTSSSGSTNMYSNFLFLGGTTVTPLDNTYHGDLIFLNGSKLDWKTNGIFKGDVMFLGDKKSTATDAFANINTQSKAWGNGNKFMFVNRYSNADQLVKTMLQNKNVVAASGNIGSLTYDGSMIKTLDTRPQAQTYTEGAGAPLIESGGLVEQYLKIDKVDGSDPDAGKYAESVAYPKTSAAFAKEGITIACPTGAASYTASSFDTTFANAPDNTCLIGGTYQITGGSGVSSFNPNPLDGPTHYYFLNGSSDYIFYIDCDINLTNAAFVVLNPGSGTAKFILGKNCDVWINNTSSARDGIHSANGLNENKMNSGFISSANYGAPSTPSEWMNTYASSYNKVTYGKKTAPTIYIYGVGNNDVSCSQYGSLEAYVGLFDDDYTSSGSSVWFSGGGAHYFGRIMTPKIIVRDGAFINCPYCPAPGSANSEKLQLQESRYTVTSFQYYY